MFQNVGADAYKPGLEGVLRLSEAFGNPHKSLRTIHIGGTNGKGSVSSLIASVLQETGLKTGLFTSPHLIDFRERIRINGEKISEQGVTDFIERYRKKNLSLEPSFFELTTVMAFEWFAKNNVDAAVIEVGLGGRLDSTNIITPELSVITNISFDHTAQLGNTPEAIAGEKAGIIKPGVPVVIGHAEGSVKQVFDDKALSVGAPIYYAHEKHWWKEAIQYPTHYIYRGTPWSDVECPLAGDCQSENAATVMCTLSLSDIKNRDAVRRGFLNVMKNTGLTGRWTIIDEKPLTVCDTGHNPGGWDLLGPRLNKIARTNHLHIVAGFVNDKDIKNILCKMPVNATYYWATPSVSRGRDARELAAEAEKSGITGTPYPTVCDAYDAARASAKPDDVIFVGGSTYVVADLLEYLKWEI